MCSHNVCKRFFVQSYEIIILVHKMDGESFENKKTEGTIKLIDNPLDEAKLINLKPDDHNIIDHTIIPSTLQEDDEDENRQ
ncbi:hypothetical protein NPIL_288511 [Nephila pilipes]|uniref:Uncharacterized protein n=1 Tax=Nephila pilipes TaxID=299642 RepID=A0A8X6TW95_NEPPI|nr:hypothetical protein NPIL_288511 [Nephila pilipes]